MENKINLREIAEENGLKYIETTSAMNGYPESIKGAIIGFKTFEEAEKLADEHDLSIESFKKKDGWQLWYRTGSRHGEAMTNSSEYYGDNYSQLEKMSEEEFIMAEILPYFTDLDRTDNCSFDFLETLISEKKELFKEIENMKVDEIIITCQGDYYETLKKESMYWAHDTNHIVIGLINRN